MSISMSIDYIDYMSNEWMNARIIAIYSTVPYRIAINTTQQEQEEGRRPRKVPCDKFLDWMIFLIFLQRTSSTVQTVRYAGLYCTYFVLYSTTQDKKGSWRDGLLARTRRLDDWLSSTTRLDSTHITLSTELIKSELSLGYGSRVNHNGRASIQFFQKRRTPRTRSDLLLHLRHLFTFPSQ